MAADVEQKAARPHGELIRELLDSRIPKNEREHAAAREIERLRAEVETGHYNWNRFMEPITSYFVYKPGFVIRPESAREDEGGPYASHPCGAAKNIMCYVDALEARAERLENALQSEIKVLRQIASFGNISDEMTAGVADRLEALLRDQEEGK